MKYQSIAALITAIQNDHLSTKSKEGYTSKLKFLHQQLSTDGTVSWLKDAMLVINWIEARYISIDSRKSYITAIVKVLNIIGQMKCSTYKFKKERITYSAHMNKYGKESLQRRELQQLNERESSNFLGLKQIIKKKNKLMNSDFEAFLLITLYTEIPPIRSEYHTVKIRNFDKTKDNYYHKGKLVFNERNKVKAYQVQIVDASPIERHLESWKKLNRTQQYLFEDSRGLPFKDSGRFAAFVRQVTKRSLNKAIGVNLFRKAYVTEFLKGCPNLQELRLVSNIMNHSLNTQQLYRCLNRIE